MEYFNGGEFSDEIVPEEDPFVRVLKGEIPVVFWTHQADQISSVLQLLKTFKIPKPVIAGASEIYLVSWPGTYYITTLVVIIESILRSRIRSDN